MAGLRYESMYIMPERMRQQVTPVMLMKELEKHKGKKPVTVDGIPFSSGKCAARYLYLLEAQEAGMIRDLRIREQVTILAPHIEPGGRKEKGIFYTSDFSYLVADFAYRDGFLMEDLAFWEAVKNEAQEDTRVFEFTERLPEKKRLKMIAKGLVIREV